MLIKMTAKFRKAETAPNTACTRRVGVAAFSSRLRGLELVPAKWRSLIPPRRIEPVEITSG